MIDYEFRRGRLTANPEIRYTPSGTKCATFTIAQSRRRWNDQTQQWDTIREQFVDCTIWTQTFTNGTEIDWPALVEANIFKGSSVMVYGHFSTDKWQDKQGNTRSKLSFTAQSVALDLTALADDPPSPSTSGDHQSRPPASTGGTTDEPPF